MGLKYIYRIAVNRIIRTGDCAAAQPDTNDVRKRCFYVARGDGADQGWIGVPGPSGIGEGEDVKGSVDGVCVCEKLCRYREKFLFFGAKGVRARSERQTE